MATLEVKLSLSVELIPYGLNRGSVPNNISTRYVNQTVNGVQLQVAPRLSQVGRLVSGNVTTQTFAPLIGLDNKYAIALAGTAFSSLNSSSFGQGPIDDSGDYVYVAVNAIASDGFYLGDPARINTDISNTLVPTTSTTVTVTTVNATSSATYVVPQYEWVHVDIPPLFTAASDVVDFNKLLPNQITAITAAAVVNNSLDKEDGDLYSSLSGNDTVTLPTIRNASNLGGSGVDYNLSTFFSLGSGTDIIYGSDGQTNINLGSGSDSVFLNGYSTTLQWGGGAANINFTTTAQSVTINGYANTSSLAVSNLAGTDKIDLAGIVANDYVYDPSSGSLSLYNVTFGMTPISVLEATVGVGKNYNASSFALSKDGSGGTLLGLGQPAPTLIQLADISSVVYSQGASADGYAAVSEYASDDSGLYADAYVSGDQVVVAIRGTVPPPGLSYDTYKTLLADTSFTVNGLPNQTLRNEVQDASVYLDRIRNLYPYAEITLTGHSLGGAIASLLGKASGYEAITFNAPGTAQLLNSLSTELQAASDSREVPSGSPQNTINYRLLGDQVSLTGVQMGSTYTIPSIYPDDYADALNNHLMASVIAGIVRDGTTFSYPVSKLPTPDGPLLGTSLISGVTIESLPNVIIKAFSFLVSDSSGLFHFADPSYIDPDAAYDYQLVGDKTSPPITAIYLPTTDGIASFTVSFQNNGVWLPPEIAAPEVPLEASSGSTGVEIQAYDYSDSPVLLPDGFIFGLDFASAGTFNGTLTEDVACFLKGTRIKTNRGQVNVEQLLVGEEVVVNSGERRSIKWIGQRSYGGPFLAANPSVQPVRICAGALGASLPGRDLFVSPEHAMLLDEVLIPAKLLVNGETVVQETDLAIVEYFHVELDSHDILLAEGAPSESFVDCDSRGMFQNAHTFTGSAPRWSFCAPRVEDGPALARVRERLRPRSPVKSSAVVQGHLDWATHEGCAGWACLPEDPEATLEVEVLVDGAVIARVTANSWRPDVKAHGHGTGRYGFELTFAQPLSRFRTGTVTARAVGGGDLVGAVQLDAATELDLACLPGLAAALQTRAATVEGACEITGFLLNQLRAVRSAPRRRETGPLALVLDHAVPRPGRDAGSAAVLSHMQSLRRLGYQVVFVPLDGQPGQLPDNVGCAAWPEFPTVEDALRQHRDAALIYVHRVEGMSLYGPLIRRTCPGARLLYSVADLHFLRVGRQAEVERSASRMAESRRLREQELAAARLADMTLTHSAAEAEVLRRLVPGAAVGVVPWHVPCGLTPYAWRRRSGLVFVGGMEHAPNADALHWLALEIMPRVVKLNPRVRCKVVGTGLTKADRSWLHPAMEILGPVEDLARVYRSARLAVAPLRFGAGVKGKVLEAFAAGLPCPMTPIAAEGLNLPEALRPLIAGEADAFARLVVTLYGDPLSNQAAGQAGRAFVANAASQESVDEALANASASSRARRFSLLSRTA